MIAINSFLDKLKVSEAKHESKFIMSIQEAKNLHTDITKLLLAIQELSTPTENDTTIEITGNDW